MDDVAELQAAIRRQLKAKGMSQVEFANKIFYEENDDDDPGRMAAFVDALKKQLSRRTTPPEKLRRYLDILLQNRTGLEVRYQAIATDELPKALRKSMLELSAGIDQMLAKSVS